MEYLDYLQFNDFSYDIEPIVDLNNEGGSDWGELLCKTATIKDMSREDWRSWYLTVEQIVANELENYYSCISVNLDTAHLLDDKIIQSIQKLKGYPVCLEWTENRFTKASECLIEAGEVFTELCSECGFDAVLDDVGRGEDSLYRMSLCRPDFVKIDGELFQRAHRDIRIHHMLKNYVRFLKKIEVPYVIEWIESKEHLCFAYTLEADYGQGYLWREKEVASESL